MRFSVIIPTCDRPGHLAACLSHLVRLDGPPGGFEVIVVDDGSVPPAGGVPPEIRLIRRSASGPAAARNAGASAATGSHLVFLDDDCRPAADWLLAYARAVARDPEHMIAGQCENGEPHNRLSRFNHHHLEAIGEILARSPHRFALTSNLCVPADLFRRLGGFDESFRQAGGEDREFCARWLAAGYAIGATEARVTHHHPQDWRAFWRMHRRYGRGARRVGRPLPRFALLRATLRRTGIGGILPYAVSQLAVVAGYFWPGVSQPAVAPQASPGDLSVAVVSYNSSATIAATLESLQRQTIAGFEVIVADSSTDGTAQLVRERFPAVRLLTFPRRLYPGAGRNAVCAASRRPVLAFLDADCIAEPDWAETILRVHAPSSDGSPWIAGGSVAVANPRSAVGWGYFFSEFAPWLPTGRARHMRDIPTCTLSVKRTAFERLGPFLETGYCSDTAFNWAACGLGRPPWFDPRIRVRHHNPERLGRILSKQRMHGRTFARLRAEMQRQSAGESIVRTLTAPLLPIYLWLRNGWWALRAPGFAWPFLKSSPYTLLTLAAWSAGEAAGYWEAARERLAPAEAR